MRALGRGPVVVPGFGGEFLDLRTMVDPYAEPDSLGVVPSLAHHYGLPMFALAGGSDSKTVDAQAATDAALTMYADALSGGHLIHDSGYLESGLTGSLTQLVICDEIEDPYRIPSNLRQGSSPENRAWRITAVLPPDAPQAAAATVAAIERALAPRRSRCAGRI